MLGLATVPALIFSITGWPSAMAQLPADLGNYSQFKEADPKALASGNVLAVPGVAMGFARGVSVETLFFLPGVSPKTVADRIRQWQPTAGVFVHHKLSIPPNVGEFRSLASLPGHKAIGKLKSETLSLSPHSPALFMSKSEAQRLEASRGGNEDETFAKFWSQLLLERATTFLTKGVAFTPPYEIKDEAIDPGKEFSELFASNKAVRTKFGLLIGYSKLAGRFSTEAEPFLQARAAEKDIRINPYWEVINAEGAGTIDLGAIFVRPVGDGAWQVMDVQYYVSGTYLVSAVLYQIQPAAFGGQSGSIVWRGDLLSIPTFTYLKGTERMAAGSIMLREVKGNVEKLRQDLLK
jgi:hypothetical protein